MSDDTSSHENDSRAGKRKKQGKLDKVLMGIVIGGAIGSVLGMTLSPKSGKENRDYVFKKSSETWEKSRALLGEIVTKKQQKKGFWHRLNEFIYRKKQK
ncbi:YtxH domain-containing protein [Candidatus Peregrinibacteria bacterium]|nr:YtxH domain-containing protein [Candidatus Peregrinibacteria bacterium]